MSVEVATGVMVASVVLGAVLRVVLIPLVAWSVTTGAEEGRDVPLSLQYMRDLLDTYHTN